MYLNELKGDTPDQDPEPEEPKSTPPLFEMILKHLDQFNAILTPSTTAPKSLGFVRMKVIEILACVMKSPYAPARAALMASPIVDTLLVSILLSLSLCFLGI